MKLKKMLKKIYKHIDDDYFISYFEKNGIRIELVKSKRLTSKEKVFNRKLSNRMGGFKNIIKKNQEKLKTEKNENLRNVLISKNEYYNDKIEELKKTRKLPSKIIKKNKKPLKIDKTTKKNKKTDKND